MVNLPQVNVSRVNTAKERNTQDFRSVYFNLFLVILPKFGSLFYTVIRIQTYMASHCLGFL